MFIPCLTSADITAIGNNNAIVIGSVPTWTATARGMWVINNTGVPLFVVAENGQTILMMLPPHSFAIRPLRDQVRQPQIKFDNTRSGAAGAITTATDWQVYIWAMDYTPQAESMGAIKS